MEEHNEQIEEQTPQEEQPVQESQPQEVKDRTTEQFEKLIESNKKLKEEKESYKTLLESLTPAEDVEVPQAQDYGNLNQDQINNVFEDMKDEDGYIDGNKLLDTLKDLNSRATSAEQRAARIEEHVKRKEVAEQEALKTDAMNSVHDKYPQLNPDNEEFNPEFYNLVRNELISQMVNGQQEDFMKAADNMSKYAVGDMNKEEKQAQQEAEQKQEQKAQINATRPKSSMMKGYYEHEEDEALRQKIIRGKKGAVAEMLKRRGQ